MKKKLLSALLATAMVASLLVGCGSKEAAPAAEATETEEVAEETEEVAEEATEEVAEETTEEATASEYAVAMITDSGDITDQSFNQATYEACVAFCEANGIDFNYYKPTDDSDEARIASTEQAIAEGYNVIVMPGYLFATTVAECAPTYEDVKFIVLDDSSAEGMANVY